MPIAIPFFGKKARAAAASSGSAPMPKAGARTPGAGTPRPNPRALRVFVRPAPTTFQRCLAAHMYFAERRSALD